MHAVVLLLLSMAVAFLLTPAVNYLQKNNMPRVIATLVMYAVVLIALGGVSYALVKSLIQQVLTFQVTLVDYANALPDRFTAFQKFLVDNGIPQSSINDALNQIRGQATAFATTLANNVLNIALIVTNTFIDILLILVLSFYFTLDGNICALLGAKDHVNVFIYDPIAPDPEGIINQGQGNLTARAIQVRQGETINERALLNLFKAVIANNRAGGWRKLKDSR